MPDSASVPNFPARPSFEQLQKQAKELLRDHHAGDPAATARIARITSPQRRPVSLADAQFVLARELGFATWAELKQNLEAARPLRIDRFRQFAVDLFRAAEGGDDAALRRIHRLFGITLTAEELRERMLVRLRAVPSAEAAGSVDAVSLADAHLFVARLYGFDTWSTFESSVEAPSTAAPSLLHGLSSRPPFYRIIPSENALEPRPSLSSEDWDHILEVMRDRGLTRLRAAGLMTDAILQRVSRAAHITSLQLEGSRRLTPAGLRHLTRMPQLESLNLTACNVTDESLEILAHLPALREFFLFHEKGISGDGLSHLAGCHHLEIVELLGSNAGDNVLHALRGKPNLRRVFTGDRVTDAGLPYLHEFPVFKIWQGREPELSLMAFQTEPNLLLLRGPLTDQGMAGLVGLDGLFGLNLDHSGLNLTSVALNHLAALPNLGWLGFDATDETMPAIAALPHLRMLMCQDTRSTDAGFHALSRSRTLEYLWGRRCHGLTGSGFTAMSRMPSLRGLSVSCLNVDDAALAALPDFPALVDFMPMDVPDEGFRHVGRCERLRAVWCMYCRDTGDIATGHLAALPRLQTYYAGKTFITDRSLEILSRMPTLEHLTFWACDGVTNAGVARLAALPRLRELHLESMPAITRDALAALPSHIQVNYSL